MYLSAVYRELFFSGYVQFLVTLLLYGCGYHND